MTQEEKAKRYDKILEQIKGLIESVREDKYAIVEGDIIDIFPELKESEGEKVKRILHSISSKMSFHLHDIFTEEEFQCFDAWSNVWLKKQGNNVNIDIESMVSSYKQRLKNQRGVENTPLVNMCLTAFRQGVENVLDELSLKKLEKQGKPKWTEEDEERLQSCIIELQGKGLMGGVDTMDSKWLKSLKQRIGE